MAPLRVVFMGTAELSCNSLQALIASPDFQVVAVVTQPDRPKGRELKLQPSPVKELALQAKLPVLQPERARDEAFLGALGELAAGLGRGRGLWPDSAREHPGFAAALAASTSTPHFCQGIAALRRFNGPS